ncbi:MAG: hypothetical protein JXB39_03825 [Deltaproteobacteria bacterium]|nr:hypothetical protein [Deltaproteobacteria bacterium]
MTKDEYDAFVRKTESLVKPVDSTAISFLGAFNKFLPIKTQRSIMEKGSRSIPYMGFIVDPYCFFLSYPVTDRTVAQAMLPEGYELADTSIFEDEAKQPTVIISAFSVRTSVFTGMRLECYLIARNRATGRVAWIITDYETNTLSNDPKNGFCGYSCDPAFFTTTPYGEISAEAVNEKTQNRYSVRADLTGGRMRELDQALWVEGNMAVDYGGRLKDPSSAPFSLLFDPVLMKEALEIPLDGVKIVENTLMKGIIDGAHPSCAACFPYAQHFVIRQDLGDQVIATSEDLLAQVGTFMGRKGFKTMRGQDITRPLFCGMVASSVLNAAIIATLLVKILFF